MKENKAFSIGDKIEILPWEDIVKDLSAQVVNSNVYFSKHGFCFNEEMNAYCGKEAIIKNIMTEYDYGYGHYVPVYILNIDDGEWSWLGEWLKKI